MNYFGVGRKESSGHRIFTERKTRIAAYWMTWTKYRPECLVNDALPLSRETFRGLLVYRPLTGTSKLLKFQRLLKQVAFQVAAHTYFWHFPDFITTTFLHLRASLAGRSATFVSYFCTFSGLHDCLCCLALRRFCLYLTVFSLEQFLPLSRKIFSLNFAQSRQMVFSSLPFIRAPGLRNVDACFIIWPCAGTRSLSFLPP